VDIYHTSTHGVALVRIKNAGLKMCCTRLAGNTWCKNDAKNCHLRTIAQLCQAIPSQLRYISTIGKTCYAAISLPHVHKVWWTSAH